MKRANDQVGFLIMVLIWLMSLLPLYGAPLKVGLVKDYARLNDRSFNQLTYQGLVQAEKELGIRGTAVVAKKDSDYLFNNVWINYWTISGYSNYFFNIKKFSSI